MGAVVSRSCGCYGNVTAYHPGARISVVWFVALRKGDSAPIRIADDGDRGQLSEAVFNHDQCRLVALDLRLHEVAITNNGMPGKGVIAEGLTIDLSPAHRTCLPT
jgi:hypothetical protein